MAVDVYVMLDFNTNDWLPVLKLFVLKLSSLVTRSYSVDLLDLRGNRQKIGMFLPTHGLSYPRN